MNRYIVKLKSLVPSRVYAAGTPAGTWRNVYADTADEAVRRVAKVCAHRFGLNYETLVSEFSITVKLSPAQSVGGVLTLEESAPEIAKARTRMAEDNDCAVVALAAALSVRYEDAHAALELAGRVRREGTITSSCYPVAASLLGFQAHRATHYGERLNTVVGRLAIEKRLPAVVCNMTHAFAVLNDPAGGIKVIDTRSQTSSRIQVRESWYFEKV